MSLYQDPRGRTKRTWLDWLLLLVVVGIAILVIITSFHNTSKLAKLLAMPPILMATVVEIAYATFLFLRARQKALGLKTPVFLHVLYYITFGLVTAVNMWGLFIEHKIWGLIIGGAISFLMWGFETTLVWFWTASHQPHQKSPRELMREAKKEIQEEKIIQRIEWMKWEARKPDLSLVKKARAAEEKRKEVVGDGLPEFFLKKEEPIKEIVAELHETQPKTVDVQESEEVKEVVPFRRQIGFHMERTDEKPKSPAPLFKPNMEARKEAIETAKRLQEELGRIPKQRELMENGISEYYAKWVRKELKNQ